MADRSEAVAVAYVLGNTVTASWHHSIVEMIAYDTANNGRIQAGGFVAMRCGTDGLVQARNEAVRCFLKYERADWLFWIDTDMGFHPNTVDRLFEAADPVERPIVGGLCFSQQEGDPDQLGGYQTKAVPTVMDWAKVKGDNGEDQYGWQIRWNFTPNAVTRVGGTGAACILVHRSVFEKIAEHPESGAWYDRIPNTSTGQLIGEDLSFCLRAGAMKFPIYVHTGVPTTHFKHLWLGERDYWQQVALRTAQEAFAGGPGDVARLADEAVAP